ncbi:hypothetical protein KRR40_30345 [Niabella defluvii]|nr:hypothetical protein KRR40_30345 [Niabella sp. I65]
MQRYNEQYTAFSKSKMNQCMLGEIFLAFVTAWPLWIIMITIIFIVKRKPQALEI